LNVENKINIADLSIKYINFLNVIANCTCELCDDYDGSKIMGCDDDFLCRRTTTIKPKVTIRYGCYMHSKLRRRYR